MSDGGGWGRGRVMPCHPAVRRSHHTRARATHTHTHIHTGSSNYGKIGRLANLHFSEKSVFVTEDLKLSRFI